MVFQLLFSSSTVSDFCNLVNFMMFTEETLPTCLCQTLLICPNPCVWPFWVLFFKAVNLVVLSKTHALFGQSQKPRAMSRLTLAGLDEGMWPYLACCQHLVENIFIGKVKRSTYTVKLSRFKRMLVISISLCS